MSELKDIFNEKMKDYMLLADRADKRLRGLERAAKREGTDKYINYAYSKAMRDINADFGGGTTFKRKLKFNENDPHASIQALEEVTADVNSFLDAPTSTYQGFEKIESSRIEKLRSYSWFPDIDEFEWLKLTQTGIFDLLSKDFGFGYKTAIRIGKQLLSNKKYVLNRKGPIKADTLFNIIDKIKFSRDPGLYKIVQGVLHPEG